MRPMINRPNCNGRNFDLNKSKCRIGGSVEYDVEDVPHPHATTVRTESRCSCIPVDWMGMRTPNKQLPQQNIERGEANRVKRGATRRNKREAVLLLKKCGRKPSSITNSGNKPTFFDVTATQNESANSRTIRNSKSLRLGLLAKERHLVSCVRRKLPT